MNDDFEDKQLPPHPFDYISPNSVQDLWGIGYTIVRRYRGDPFHVPPEMVPQGRSYQWMHVVNDRVWIESGWAAVPASRHDGYFMPFGTAGAIEVSGLGLFEKPKFEVERDQAQNVAAAKQQVADWSKEVAGAGISGSVSFGNGVEIVGDVSEAKKFGQFKTVEKTIETTVRFPPDMLEHAEKVFAERDRLYRELQDDRTVGNPPARWQMDVLDAYQAAVDSNPKTLKGPTFLALLLPRAIENVRRNLAYPAPMQDKLKAKLAELKEEKNDD